MASQWYNREKIQHCTWQALKTAGGLTYYYNRETKEVTWDCPPELATTGGAGTGDWYWIPDSAELYTPARKVGPKAFETESGTTKSLSTKTIEHYVYPLTYASLSRTVEDLVLLDDLHPPLILHNLKKRFEQDYFYTEIGTILIAINPYRQFPLYSSDIVDEYQRALRNFEQKKPHVFKVADTAFRSMFFKTDKNTGARINQSIVISGDSGSGKTEATKHCLRYLARISSTKLEISVPNSQTNSKDSLTGNIEERILMTNPILESFGNAKTIRNNNSSRFGKYIKIYFSDTASIKGAKVESYLLEKIRVVSQAKDERNYHIFYQLLSGNESKPKKRKSKHLDVIPGDDEHKLNTQIETITSQTTSNTMLTGKSTSHFDFLSKTKCTKVEGIDDAEEFVETVKAFVLLGLSEDKITEIFQLVSAVLYIGNIDFKEESNDSCAISSKSKSQEGLKSAAKLMSVKLEGLQNALTKKITNISGQVIKGDIRIADAFKARDALSKSIYSRLFSYIVKTVNSSLKVSKKEDNLSSIGILDIFGFEIFKKNSLEQLCINYTNERLQQLFNLTTFKQEEELYSREGIKFESVCHWDNSSVISAIGGKSTTSLFSLIDEELKIPGGNINALITKFRDVTKQNSKKGNSVIQAGFDNLKVVHYAGDVTYDPIEFLEKNNDTLMPNLIELLSASDGLLATLFEEDAKLLKKGGGKFKKSVCKRFNTELNQLMDNLSKTGTHYIRCVKPNDMKKAGVFHSKRAYEQLLYAGVFEAVKIRKTGYPFHLTLKEFAERYGILFNIKGTDAEAVKKIVKEFKLNKNNVRIGKTRIFYRSGEFRTMELKWSIQTEKTRINETLDKLCKELEASGEKMDETKLEELVRFIIRAEELNLDNKHTQKADKIYEKAVESRMDSKTKKMIEKALQCKDENFIRSVLTVIDKHRYRTRKCLKLKEIYKKLSSANRALERGLRLVKQDALQEGLDKAALVPLTADESQLVANAKIYLDNIIYIDQILQNLFAIGNTDPLTPEQLQPEIERAATINYTSRDVVKAKVYVNRMNSIVKASKTVLEYLQEDEMQTLLEAAKEVRYTNSDIKKIKAKLGMSKNELRKDQLRISAKLNDKERVFWLTVQVKNDILLLHKMTFELPNFSHLIGAEAYSKYQFFGRAELLETYLKWTKKPIPHSLTDLNHIDESMTDLGGKGDKNLTKKLKKFAISIFKMIQIISGDKPETKTKTVEKCRIGLLSLGITYMPLRDEIFVQLIKQMNGNPNPDSKQKVLDLLKICISSFPPSEDFQSFLEAWILNKLTGVQQTTFLYILHYKCYHAEIVQGVPRSRQRLKVPNEDEIRLALQSEYKNDIQEPIPHMFKSDLKDIERALESELAAELQKSKVVIKNEDEDNEGDNEEDDNVIPAPPEQDEVFNEIAVPDVVNDGDHDNIEVPDLDAYLDSDEEDGPPPV